MKQNQQNIDVVEHLIGQEQSIKYFGNKKYLQKQKIVVCTLLVIMFLIGIVVTSTVVLNNQNKDQSHQILVQQVKKQDIFIGFQSQIVKDNDAYIIDGVSSKDITKLILDNLQRINITLKHFPKLKQVVINDSSHYFLNLDQKLKLETLTIKNSGMTSFSYNSSEIKNIHFINNDCLLNFQYSNLPSLNNLTIQNTPFSNWINNTFGIIGSIEISNHYTYFPNINSSEIRQMKIKNSVVSGQRQYLQNSKIKTFIINNSTLQYPISNNQHIQSIDFQCQALLNISIFNCSQLKNINLKNMGLLKTIIVNQTAKLSNLEIKNINLQRLQLINTNITNININTSTLTNLTLLNTPLNEIGLLNLMNAPLLCQLILDYQRITTKQPFKFNIPNLHDLALINYHFHKDSLNITHFSVLVNLTLINSSAFNIILNAQKLRFFMLKNVELQRFSSGNIAAENLLNLWLDKVNIVDITYFNFTNLISIIIKQCSNLKSITGNNLPNVQQFHIKNCSSLNTIQNNNINTTSIVIQQNPLLKWNQKYNSTVRIFISDIDDCFLQDILTVYTNNSKYLMYTPPNSVISSNLSSSKLNQIRLECNKDCQFINNSLPRSLNIIQLINVSKFSGNRFLRLDNLYIIQCPNMKSQDLMNQLKLIKDDGVTIYYLLIGQQRKQELFDSIKQIFPNIIIN